MRVSKGVLAIIVTLLILIVSVTALFVLKAHNASSSTNPIQMGQLLNAKEISPQEYPQNLTGTVPELNKTLKYLVTINAYMGGQLVEKSNRAIIDYGDVIKESVHQVIIAQGQHMQTRFDAVVMFNKMYIHYIIPDRYLLIEGIEAATEYQKRVEQREALVLILQNPKNTATDPYFELARAYVVGEIQSVNVEKMRLTDNSFSIELTGKTNAPQGIVEFEIKITGNLV